jgi:hemolysin activation/secretion protein
LRGFRQERFAGDASFYQSTDLRLRLINKAKTYIAPISFGIFGSFDYGRVWLEEEESGIWHHSYGGGVWLSTLDFITFTASLQHSDESNRVIVKARFNF